MLDLSKCDFGVTSLELFSALIFHHGSVLKNFNLPQDDAQGNAQKSKLLYQMVRRILHSTQVIRISNDLLRGDRPPSTSKGQSCAEFSPSLRVAGPPDDTPSWS